MTSKRDTVASIRARRAAEDEKLRAELARVREKREALVAREAEILELLGERPAQIQEQHVTRTEPGWPQRCLDCNATIWEEQVATAKGACPACHAEPFEGSQIQ